MSKPSGRVYLCKNALVDRSYSHTIDFKGPNEQYAYWGSLVKYSLEEYTYIRRESQFIKVEKTLDELQDVNYLYYRASDSSKLYYCFVTSKEYKTDNTTYIYFETDVLQTYMFDYKIKPSYVLQEHCDRWDANLKPIYSRTDEGLDYGPEYTVESGYKIKPTTNDDTNIRWFLAICKPNGSIADGGQNTSNPDNVGLVNSYLYFLLPTLPTGSANMFAVQYKNSDNENVTSQIHGLREFLRAMSNGDLGTYVQQIIKLPYLPFKVGYSHPSGVVGIDFRNIGDDVNLTISNLEYPAGIANMFLRISYFTGSLVNKLAEMDWDEGIKESMPTAEQWAKVKANPYTTERDKRFESKLLTHPYRYNLLSDWRGTPVVIKNEYLSGDKIKVNYTQSLSFNSPARYWVEGYKKDPEGRASSVVQLVPEEAPVSNDAYYSYMLQNKNQLKADQTNAMLSGVTSTLPAVLGGAMTGALAGGPAGAMVGAVVGGGATLLNNIGNYSNLIRSQNAKQQDLKNLPDTILNPNDSNFSYHDNNEYLTFYRMKICCEFEELLADTFAMTGYTVKRVKVPNIRSRVRYNYIKTIGANIVGSFDQDDLAIIKAIFDSGVTFWHYNTVNFKMFDYSLENIETKLI